MQYYFTFPNPFRKIIPGFPTPLQQKRNILDMKIKYMRSVQKSRKTNPAVMFKVLHPKLH